MLDDTLIIWGGEFGRTPTVELNDTGKEKKGRDHNSLRLLDVAGRRRRERRHGLWRDR